MFRKLWSGRGENVLLPPAEWLIAQHPLPLTINRITDGAISEQLIVRVISVVALNGCRILVAVNLARLGEVNLLHPLRVALQRLGNADTSDAVVSGRAGAVGMGAFDVVAEGSQGVGVVEVVGLFLPWAVFQDTGEG